MEINCNLSHCTYYSILTVLSIIIFVIVLDVTLYTLYSYYYVDKYYSEDLKDWRDNQLKKFTHIMPGDPGSSWSEFHPPVDQIVNYIDSNNDWIWGLTKKNTYVCKKPCNGKTDDHIWRKLQNKINLSQISVGNNYAWGSDGHAYFSNKPDGTGKIVKNRNKFRSLSIGHTGWIWAIYKDTPFKCSQQNMCTGLKKDKWLKMRGVRSVNLTVGNNYVWCLDNSGKLFQNNSDGSGKWTIINTDEKQGPLISISAGKDDILYAVNKNNKLFKCLNGFKWTEIEDSPDFKHIKVTNTIIGIDVNNKLWIAPLEKL